MLITNLSSAIMSIVWVLVMFSLVREMRDCCVVQIYNVTLTWKNSDLKKKFQLHFIAGVNSFVHYNHVVKI